MSKRIDQEVIDAAIEVVAGWAGTSNMTDCCRELATAVRRYNELLNPHVHDYRAESMTTGTESSDVSVMWRCQGCRDTRSIQVMSP